MLVDFTPEPTHPSDSDSMLDRALDNIRRGIEQALLHRPYGLRVRIHEFRIHPVDFQPARFLQHSYVYTRNLLDAIDQ